MGRVAGIVGTMAVLAGAAVLFAAPAAVGARHRSVRPVPGRLLRYLSQGPIVFGPAGPRARPRISATVASRDAVRDVQWRPASAVGVSLVRLGRREGADSGRLAWVVALKPRHPPRGADCAPPANYVVAYIAAWDGRFDGDAAGYNPLLTGRGGGCAWAMGELNGPSPRR